MNPSTQTRQRNAPLELTIRNRGLVDHGASGAYLILLVIVVSGVVGWFVNPWAGLLAAALLIAVSWRSFTPVVFEFGPLGVAQKIAGRKPRRIAWTEMGRVEFLDRGLLITVDPEQPLGSLRSVYVCYCGQRAQLEQLVSTYVRAQQQRAPVARHGSSTVDFSTDR